MTDALPSQLGGVLAVAALLLSAWALGKRLLRPFPDAGALAPVLATALGLGACALVTLGLGLAGLLYPWLFRALLLTGSAWAIRDLWKARGRLSAWASGLRLDGLDLAQASAAVLLVLPMAAGIFVLPWQDYDALEYHLGAPAAHLREGRVRFLEDNAFAAFPEHQEMLYLAGLAATGSHPGGAAAAKAVNLACWLLAAAALLALGRRHGDRRAGGWAALALLASPWAMLTGGWMVYNEPGLALFALLAGAAAWEAGTAKSRPWALLAGLLAGLAFGVKYPGALFVVLPLGAALACRGLIFPFLLGALIPTSPWLLKNLLATGNPVFPLLARWLGPEGWDWARFDAAHAPGSVSWEALIRALRDLGSGMLIAPPLLVFLLFGWKREAHARGPRLGILIWTAFGAALWFLFTHRVDRFCLLFVPLLCLAVGFGVEALARLPGGWIGRAVAGAVLVFAAGAGLMHAAAALREAAPVAGETWEDVLVRQAREARATYSAAAIREVNRLPAGSRVLFVGEAQTFYVRLDGAVTIAAPTVFDAKPFEAAVAASLAADGTVDWGTVAGFLRSRGFTHLYVNWPELLRLQTTYGDRKRGYSRLLTSRPDEAPELADNFFDRLEAAGQARRIWEDGGGRWRILAL